MQCWMIYGQRRKTDVDSDLMFERRISSRGACFCSAMWEKEMCSALLSVHNGIISACTHFCCVRMQSIPYISSYLRVFLPFSSNNVSNIFHFCVKSIPPLTFSHPCCWFLQEGIIKQGSHITPCTNKMNISAITTLLPPSPPLLCT